MSPSTVPPATGKKKAGPAKPAKGARKRTGGGRRGSNKKKKKDKLKCGESGTYGNLKKKTGGGQFDRDHVPAKSALKEFARKEIMGGKALCKLQKSAIDKVGNAIAIPQGVHKKYSPTYGGSNTPSRINTDSGPPPGGPQAAAKRDTAAVSKGMKNPCKKKYDAWARKINKLTDNDYYKMLDKAIKPFKKK